MFSLAYIAVCLIIVACGIFDSVGVQSVECIKGVQYYNYSYGFAPAFKPDGTLYTCATTE
jgi:hypothetical protein